MSVRDPKGLEAAYRAQDNVSSDRVAQIIAAYFDALDTDELAEAVAEAIRPLFRHGGGVSYGWNSDKNGFGIWDHRRMDWMEGPQEWPADIGDLDGRRFFARRVLNAIGLLPTGRPER